MDEQGSGCVFACCHPALAIRAPRRADACASSPVYETVPGVPPHALPSAAGGPGAQDHPREGQGQDSSHSLPRYHRGEFLSRQAASPASSPSSSSSSTRSTSATGPDTDPRASQPGRQGDPAHSPDPCPGAGGRYVAGLLALMLLRSATAPARVSTSRRTRSASSAGPWTWTPR